MPYSSSLSDKEWEIIEPLLPQKKKTRPPVWTKRQILDGIFYQLKNGCNWCDLPQDLPPYSTVFWHYKQWRSDGVLDQIMKTLHSRVRRSLNIDNQTLIKNRNYFNTRYSKHRLCFFLSCHKFLCTN
ncbi:transposase [Mastigocladopsis repens]|uniref:transposase n=1 Tax=Mastigocladopsis repens TaxID=221287 RepID=UPI0018DB7058|nr:transposase [Mastigocladopsis repens]